MEILLDGKKLEVREGATLGSVLGPREPGLAVAVIRPRTAEAAETRTVQVVTTKGEVVVELLKAGPEILSAPRGGQPLQLHWADRYATAFGPFPSDIVPARAPQRYSRGDVLLGCGGYDPSRSYLIFSRMDHEADHGAAADGGVIGRVISGKGVIDRWAEGDRIEKTERIFTWADRSTAFTTTDPALSLEDGMQVVTRVEALAQGYTPGSIDVKAAGLLEHLHLALEKGHFLVTRASSTHVRDESLSDPHLPEGVKGFRGEGTMTLRTRGPAAGAVYIYRADVAANSAHAVIGHVVHGIELVRVAGEGDRLAIGVTPARIDFIGLPAPEALRLAGERGLSASIDDGEPGRVVVDQDPGTTLEMLAEGSVRLATAPEGKVLAVRLYRAEAPRTCQIFREITGLTRHALGRMFLFFRFEDISLFKAELREGMKILPEHIPQEEVPAFTLGMTNDARRGAGTIGIRAAAHGEFGPTAEPFEGTNIFGLLLDNGKYAGLKEKDMVYVKEVL
ncbi:MAG TPA: methanogenesis marker 3 protein [Methanomicrobiales archaeon]|nr:methanogenesis marker 3 protein [Methanomicrobiales archaeon]